MEHVFFSPVVTISFDLLGSTGTANVKCRITQMI